MVFEQLFPHKERLKMYILCLLSIKEAACKSCSKTNILNVLPGNLAQMEKRFRLCQQKEMKKRPFYLKQKEQESVQLLFTGCLMDTMFMETNNATIALLQKAGCKVVIPEVQTCCGALHAHGGEKIRQKVSKTKYYGV